MAIRGIFLSAHHRNMVRPDACGESFDAAWEEIWIGRIAPEFPSEINVPQPRRYAGRTDGLVVVMRDMAGVRFGPNVGDDLDGVVPKKCEEIGQCMN
jgi:hypothetical protein